MSALTAGQHTHQLGMIEGVKKGHLKRVDKFKDDYRHASIGTLFQEAGYATLADGDFPGRNPESLGVETPGEATWFAIGRDMESKAGWIGKFGVAGATNVRVPTALKQNKGEAF